MDIFEKIKKMRLELDMTQLELAKQVGYKSKSTIAKIEKGTRDVTRDKVIEFAKALNTTPAYLMGWEEEKTEEYTPPAVVAAHSEKELTEEQQEKVMEYIKFLKSQE